MTKRIFRSIVLVAMVVLLASLTLVMALLYSHFAQVQQNQLRVETALAAHAVANQGMAYFEELDDTMDCRITWIGADGQVLYDSRSDTGAMVNHLEREEVAQALKDGYGQSTRYSLTLMQQYTYAAERLPDGTVLRLSASRQSLFQLLGNLMWPIILTICAAVGLSLWLANRLSRQIVRPLNTLDLNRPLENRAYPEVRPLLQRMDLQQEQLRQQRRELEQRQKEFQTVTGALPEGLVLVSSSGSVLSINPAAASILQVTSSCVGADFSVVNQDSVITGLMETGLSGKKAERIVHLKQGDYVAAARPVKTKGTLSGVVLLLLDMTQKQKAEAIRREFTANVSHELKTPLHAISGYAELLKSGLVREEDASDFYEKIYGQAQRLITLVEDLLRLSRLDEGAADMEWVANDLYEALCRTARELEGPAELAGVRLEVRGEPAVLQGIPQLHSALLFNLLDNAIKYNRPGGRIEATVENQQNHVVLTVSDTGQGIPREQQERVFERFYRGDQSHSKELGGTGLGLSIVKHAARILHGELQLDSVPGQGTTITVVFPKEPAKEG